MFSWNNVKTNCHMKTCINRVELQGVVGASRVTEAGDGNIINFSLATNYAYKDIEGCPVIETTWHVCTAYAGREDDLTMYKKGALLHVEGRIRNKRYTDANGHERATQEILASKVEKVEQVKP